MAPYRLIDCVGLLEEDEGCVIRLSFDKYLHSDNMSIMDFAVYAKLQLGGRKH